MAVAAGGLSGCADGPAESLDPRLAAADSIVAAWVDEGAVAGAVLSVSRNGEELIERAYGSAFLFDFGTGQYPDPADAALHRLSSPEPMTTETVFDLASVTKVMATTLGAMALVDDGLLDLDAPVSSALADFVGDGREAITARHLLTHRSGLPQWKPIYYHASDAEGAYEFIRTVPLEWPVGEGRHYSDLGFMLLGRLVEQLSGSALPDFLDSRIYARVGLERTAFTPIAADGVSFAATSHGNPFERRMVHDSDFGYSIEGDPEAWSDWRRYTLRGEVNDGNAHHAFGGVAGHAGLFSNAPELRTLLEVLLDGGRAGNTSIVSEGVVTAFLTPGPDPRQALGWQMPSYVPDSGFSHTGFTGTFVMGVRDEGLAVVLLTNRQNTGVGEDTRYIDVGPLQEAVVAALTAPERGG